MSEIETTRQFIEWNVATDSRAYPRDRVNKMRGLVAGTLDRWLGKDGRHYLIDALFGSEHDTSGSTKVVGCPSTCTGGRSG